MTADDIEAWVDAASGALSLPIAPAHRPGVVRYLALAASHAALLEAFPLGLEDEPAPVFTPVSPPESGR